MRRPKVTLPAEDPATKAAREREQRRAENSRTEETQALLMGDTVRRLRRFGRIGSGGNVPVYGGSSGGGSSPGSIFSGSGGGAGAVGGASGGSGAGLGSGVPVLY